MFLYLRLGGLEGSGGGDRLFRSLNMLLSITLLEVTTVLRDDSRLTNFSNLSHRCSKVREDNSWRHFLLNIVLICFSSGCPVVGTSVGERGVESRLARQENISSMAVR